MATTRVLMDGSRESWRTVHQYLKKGLNLLLLLPIPNLSNAVKLRKSLYQYQRRHESMTFIVHRMGDGGVYVGFI